MTERKVIEIPGVSHGAPIPMGAKMGSIVYSSAIMGKDSRTNELPLDSDTQIICLFKNIQSFMEQAGGSPDHIIRMSVYLKDNQYRKVFNEKWLKMFPDKKSRPARHITIMEDLSHGMVAQVELVAVIQ